MSKTRSITLAGCGVLSLALASAAQAVVTNPEGFETYATTTTGWTPTQLGEGWTVDAPNVNISVGTGTNTTQVLDMTDNTTANIVATWYPGVTAATRTLSFDFQLVTGVPFNRASINNYGNLIEITPDSNGALMYGSTTGGVSFSETETLDGSAGLSLDTWYTIEMELDTTAGQTRARFGTMGGTPGAWSALRFFNKATDNPTFQGNGHVQYDNVALTPEPASLALLGLGGMLMLGRRRR